MASQLHTQTAPGAFLQVDDTYLPPAAREQFWSHLVQVRFNGTMHQMAYSDVLRIPGLRDAMMIKQKYLEYCKQHSSSAYVLSTTTIASASAQPQVFQGVNGLAEFPQSVKLCNICNTILVPIGDAYCRDCSQHLTQQIKRYTDQVGGAQYSHQHKGVQHTVTLPALPTPPFTSPPFEPSNTPKAGTKSIVSRSDFIDLTQADGGDMPVLATSQLPVQSPQPFLSGVEKTTIDQNQEEQMSRSSGPKVITPGCDEPSDNLHASIPTSSPTPLMATPRKKGGRTAWERAICEDCGKKYPFSRITEATSCTRCIRKEKKKAAREANANPGPAKNDELNKMPACRPDVSQRNESQDEVASRISDSAAAVEQLRSITEAGMYEELEGSASQARVATPKTSQHVPKCFESVKAALKADSMQSLANASAGARTPWTPAALQRVAPVAPMLSQPGPRRFTQEDLDTIAPHNIYDPERFVPSDRPIQSIERESDPAAEAEATMTWTERVEYGYVVPWEMDHDLVEKVMGSGVSRDV